MNTALITDAIAELDAEIAKLTNARDALFTAIDVLTELPVPPEQAEAEVEVDVKPLATGGIIVTQNHVEPQRVADLIQITRTPKAQPTPKRHKNAKHDWDAIGEVARIAERAGQPIAKTIADEFGVNTTTAQWMVKRCRELGHIGPSERFTKEPMTREPFDPQAARERAAAAL